MAQAREKARDVIRKAARRGAQTIKGSIRKRYGSQPYPLTRAMALQRALPGKAPLLDPPLAEDGSGLAHPALRTALQTEEFGVWALGVATLNFIQEFIMRRRPGFILELGSGLSTVCLARYMLDVHPDSSDRLILSLEQDEMQADRTRALLLQHGFDGVAQVEVSPVIPQVVDGRETRCFDLRNLHEWLGGERPDLLLIDGPSGSPGVRFGTLPLATDQLADGCSFLLDDALRPAELSIASEWAKRPGVTIDGVVFIDKGLLTGRVHQEP